MLSTSTLRHLRIPFSYFLLPVFLFALSVSPNLILERLQWVFVILHFLVYPASNGYNSYFDKDEQSIGGLKYPPPVSRELYWTALGLDILAVILSVRFVSLDFAVMVTLYGLASKAYSHPWIRLKKYPIYGWLVTGFFQGCFTFLMCYMGLNKYGLSAVTQAQVLLPAALTSFMLWANYPMTQVYQHEEDARHGDRTLSRMLGIRGTFGFSAAFFGLTAIGFVFYFSLYFSLRQSLAFLCALVPVVGYFGFWFWQVWKDSAKADYTRTMRLNFVSATSLVIFFTWLLLDARNVGRYLFG